MLVACLWRSVCLSVGSLWSDGTANCFFDCARLSCGWRLEVGGCWDGMYLARPVPSVRRWEENLKGIIEGQAGGQAGSVDLLIPPLFYFYRGHDTSLGWEGTGFTRKLGVQPGENRLREFSTMGYGAVTVMGFGSDVALVESASFHCPDHNCAPGSYQLNLSGDFLWWP